MKHKLIFALLALTILVIGVSQAVSITQGNGYQIVVSGLQNNQEIKVVGEGYINAANGMYKAELPNFVLPVMIKEGSLTVDITGTTLNQMIITNGNVRFSQVTRNSHITQIVNNIPSGTYSATVQGKSSGDKIYCVFTAIGKKQGTNNFVLDFNSLNGKGKLSVTVYVDNVKSFEGSFGEDPIKTMEVTITPTPTPIQKVYYYPVKPKTTPTPVTTQTTKSPGQIWAERNCWWYRV
jgi:hypothetical protein